jgi:23S rRNA pseudouridine2605 synthase
VATLADPRGRRDLRPFLAGLPERVFPVGRLDRDSEGLLLLTNDGALAERLTHPRHHVPKTYAVTVRGHPSAQALAAMAEGLRRPELTTRPAGVRLEAVLEDRTRLTVTLWEGQRRQIRRMFEAFGHEVLRLKRVAIGPLADPALRPGEVRPLRREEVAALLGAALAEAPRHPESPGGRRAPSGAAGRRATRRPAPVPRRRREVGREDGGRQRR